MILYQEKEALSPMDCREALFVLLLKKRTDERDANEVRAAFRHVDDCRTCHWAAGAIKDKGTRATATAITLFFKEHELPSGDPITDETAEDIAAWFRTAYHRYLMSS